MYGYLMMGHPCTKFIDLQIISSVILIVQMTNCVQSIYKSGEQNKIEKT